MPVADYHEGWQTTGGPLVAKGKVLQGIVGQAPGGGAVVALDARDRQGGLALPHHRAARRVRRRQLERRAAGEAQRRLGLDRRQL